MDNDYPQTLKGERCYCSNHSGITTLTLEKREFAIEVIVDVAVGSSLFALEPTENSSRHHGFTRESRIFAGVSPLSTMALPNGHHFEFVDST